MARNRRASVDSLRETTSGAVTSVTRTKLGCFTCRARHKACDHRKGSNPYGGPCAACTTLRLTCLGYGEKSPEFYKNGGKAKLVKRIKAHIKQRGHDRYLPVLDICDLYGSAGFEPDFSCPINEGDTEGEDDKSRAGSTSADTSDTGSSLQAFTSLSVQTSFPQPPAMEYGDVSPVSLLPSASPSPIGSLVDGPLYPGMHPDEIQRWLRYHPHVLRIAQTTPPRPVQHHRLPHHHAVAHAAYPYELFGDPSMSAAESVAVSQVGNINEVLLDTPVLPPGLLDDPTPDEMAIHAYVNVAWGRPESEWHLSDGGLRQFEFLERDALSPSPSSQ